MRNFWLYFYWNIDNWNIDRGKYKKRPLQRRTFDSKPTSISAEMGDKLEAWGWDEKAFLGSVVISIYQVQLSNVKRKMKKRK